MKQVSMIGFDVLGAAGDRAVLVKVKNVAELVKKQAGATGAFANMLLPDTIESKVYAELKDKLIAGFKDQGVSADVSIVVPKDYKSSAGTFLRNAAVGAGALGVGWAVWHFVLSGFFRRS